MKIYLLRHGQTDWNLAKKWQGSQDIELNSTGINQAKSVAKRFDSYKIDKIYSSPLSRAKETAKIIGENRNLQLHIEEDLREIALGEWEGLTYDEVIREYKSCLDSWEDNSLEEIGFGVESYYNLQNRAFNVLNKICEESSGDILIVAHGAWIMAVICKIMHIPLKHRMCFEVSNTGITTIEYTNSKFVMKTLNDVMHI